MPCRRLGGAQAQYLPRLRWRGRTAPEALAVVSDLLDQLGVARGEAVGGDLQVVFEAGAAVPAGLEAPLVHFPLRASHSRRHPRGSRQDLRNFLSQKVED